jgi:acetyl-CoA carboxylase biotin carboxyl carrier protein
VYKVQLHPAGAKDPVTELSREDVLEILEIIDKSQFDFFELQLGELKLTVSRNGVPAAGLVNLPQPALQSRVSPPHLAPTAPLPPNIAPSVTEPPVQVADVSRGKNLAPVKAPMVGMFYAQAEPGAPPYVHVGSHVEEDTMLGLIEVMKVFNAIHAGVRGVVAEILVQNAQFVEFGQTLFLIRPDDASRGSA